MATDLEFKGFYKDGYFKLLDLLKSVKYENPESYKVFAAKTEEYRAWVKSLTQADDLPEVPKD